MQAGKVYLKPFELSNWHFDTNNDLDESFLFILWNSLGQNYSYALGTKQKESNQPMNVKNLDKLNVLCLNLLKSFLKPRLSLICFFLSQIILFSKVEVSYIACNCYVSFFFLFFCRRSVVFFCVMFHQTKLFNSCFEEITTLQTKLLLPTILSVPD